MQSEEVIPQETDEIRKKSEEKETIYLLEKIKRGDEIAFEDFVNKYIGFVVDYVKMRITDYDVLNEIVIDTFERVYFKIKAFHYTNKKELMSWIICVCKTIIYKHYNRNSVREENRVVYDGEYIETLVEEKRERNVDERISELKEILNDVEITIIKEHIEYETTFSVIGKELNMSASKVSNIYYRAVAKCREAFKEK